MLVRLGQLMECSGALPTTQFAYRKGLGTYDALLCMSNTLQSARQEARIVQIDFNAAFDRVNHLGILYKLCSVGIVGSILSILTQFLSSRSQQVMVDGCRDKVNSAADTHLKLLDRAVSGAQFLTGGVFECGISHRRSVAVLCMLYKIRCNLVHPLNDALDGLYVPAWVTRGALFEHRYTCAPPRCRTLEYSRTFIHSRCQSERSF